MTTISRADAIATLTAPGAPYELHTIETDRGPIRVFANLPQTLPDLYAANVSDREFLVFEHERRTFREVHQLITGFARVLVDEFEVRPGDRVAISMRNYPEWMIAFGAITCVGAIAVAMNSLWQNDEMAYALHDSNPKVLIADRERLEQFRQISVDDVRLSGISTISVRAPGEANDLHRMIDAFSPTTMPAVDVRPETPAVILYTSGSTGHPKGVVSNHRAVLSAPYAWELDGAQIQLRAAKTDDPVAIEPGESATHTPTALLGIPLFHVMGLHGGFLSSWRAQRRVVCMTKWDVALAAELIERERITSFSAPPAMTGDLVREARRTHRDLSSLASVGGGGAARAPEQVRQIDETFKGAIATIGWGMTETNAAGTYLLGAEYTANPTSAGYALAPVDLRVVDDGGTPLPPGERGELQVRGSIMFDEYWNRPDAMAESFAEDGWFRTGDVAHLDADGLLFIVDRIKDLIIRGGENIGCGQVEAALLSHPHIVEAAVYAVPDERLGEAVAATVHGDAELDLDELRSFLLAHLARHEVPRHIFTTADPLPRTATGKLFKRQLRDESVARLTP